MDIEVHVAMVETYGGIWVRGKVIENLGDRFCFVLGISVTFKGD